MAPLMSAVRVPASGLVVAAFVASMLVKSTLGLMQAAQVNSSIDAVASTSANEPYLIPLRRESVPVRRYGKIASFKTSYSGLLSIGSPAQEFRVVFDTGSGHVVLPAAECQSESCQVHSRYNMTASQTAVPINMDGSIVPPGDLCDQVTIGFGTGSVTGEFARDTVCLGDHTGHDTTLPAAEGSKSLASSHELCMEVFVVVAVEMSTQPFKSFAFDGILGLGLSSLALTSNFSFFELLSQKNQNQASQFGIFLTEGEDGEESEIAIGGNNKARLLEPLSWSPVVMADLGYWQVEIKAIRIDGRTLDICLDGTCRGVVDSGTSHLGIPSVANKEVQDLLTMDAGDLLDCRLAQAPIIEIELATKNLTISAETYMRRLPLREGVTVGSATGVTLDNSTDNATETTTTTTVAPVLLNLTDDDANVKRHCSPRLMPVNLPEPLGPKLFILGEPILHRYYTVYDWKSEAVGFGLAANRRNMGTHLIADSNGELPHEVEVLLMQKTVQMTTKKAEEEEEEDAIFVQVQVVAMKVTRRI